MNDRDLFLNNESRVLVTGGRTYNDGYALYNALDALLPAHPNLVILHGACTDPRTRELRGADRLAELWAIENEIPYIGVPAKWRRFGNAAGPIRNKEMVEHWRATNGVAFPGGPGTDNAIACMREAHLVVWEIGRAPHVRRKLVP